MSNTANATKLNHRYNDLDELRGAVRKTEQHLTWMLQGYLNAGGAEETLQGLLGDVLTLAQEYLEVEPKPVKATKSTKTTKVKTK